MTVLILHGDEARAAPAAHPNRAPAPGGVFLLLKPCGNICMSHQVTCGRIGVSRTISRMLSTTEITSEMKRMSSGDECDSEKNSTIEVSSLIWIRGVGLYRGPWEIYAHYRNGAWKEGT